MYHLLTQQHLSALPRVSNVPVIMNSELAICQRTRRTYQPESANFPGTTPAPFDDRWHRGGLIVVAEVTERCRDRVQTHVKAVT